MLSDRFTINSHLQFLPVVWTQMNIHHSPELLFPFGKMKRVILTLKMKISAYESQKCPPFSVKVWNNSSTKIIIIINELWEEEVWALPAEALQSHKFQLSHSPGSEAPDILFSSGRSQKWVQGPIDQNKWRSETWAVRVNNNNNNKNEFRLSVLGKADRQVRIRMCVSEDFKYLAVPVRT